MSNQIFQTLKELPTPLVESQCVLHKHELLICGGYQQRACYSYHTIKNEYKLICEYPGDVELIGHCVVKLVDNNKDINQITLLHTLMMEYVSVWSENEMNKSKKLNKFNKSNNYNEWVPFTDNHNHQIQIGNDYDNYIGVRAVISGSNNHLLFITYQLQNISVFDLNTFQFIKHDNLPIDNHIYYHCFVSNPENGQVQEMIKTNEKKNKRNYQMLLFCFKTGLSIEYDEDNNTFQFHQIPVCKDIAPFYAYAYVCINDIILFFGGYGNRTCSKFVHKYSIRENKWMIFQNTLPSPLCNFVAILSEEDNHIYIIGGEDDKKIISLTHIKTKVREWDPSQLVIICLFSKNEIKFNIAHWIRTLQIEFGWIDDFDKIIMKYIR
ncbi:hypothetical protein RFI_18988 [Reticulomyxa filosa]|uniref:Kelch motif family protein n=1 Tax=Reticulomyxa filosa TaxID=46433 RepID=X6MXE0_RETFI|nr:hypothetical protein RFI_18988 [Reticulomyxa filosa]|eukprot:ETO18291.1 hypothetical protein RFI_18988 [Reticulomyxa filosa]